jgi:hypothetical protein
MIGFNLDLDTLPCAGVAMFESVIVVIFKVYFIWKCIKIIFLKFIFDINALKWCENT